VPRQLLPNARPVFLRRHFFPHRMAVLAGMTASCSPEERSIDSMSHLTIAAAADVTILRLCSRLKFWW
jgi:hypothetical protein